MPKKTAPEENKRQRIERWLSDKTTWVGVFRNADLGSPMVGHTVAMPFDVSDWGKVEVGTRGPDALRKFGYIPWQYVLIAKCLDADQVLTFIDEGDSQ